MSSKTILYEARIFTGEPNGYYEDGAICIDESTGLVCDVGSCTEVLERHKGAELLSMKRGLIMPGFVCAHGHFYSMFSRGMALSDVPPSNFMEILERVWWRLDRALTTEEHVHVSALVCALAAARAGTTTILDHHASPSFIKNSLDAIANATTRVGVRACLCYEVTDRNGLEGAREGIQENIRFIKKCYEDDDSANGVDKDMLGATFGLHAAFTVNDDVLQLCREEFTKLSPRTQQKTGYHIHVAEDKADETHSMQTYGMRTVVRLAKHEILGPNSIAAHCVHIDEEEMDVLVKTRTSVVHNPESNMNNAVGTTKVEHLIDNGITVGLGTDGMTMNMIQESKVNYLLHKHSQKDPRAMGSTTLDMLIGNNSKIASKYFRNKVGVLVPGANADIAILDYDPPTPLSAGNMPWHFQFGFDASMVRHTIVGGRFVMRDRIIQTIDETEVFERARAACPEVWEQFIRIAEEEKVE